MVWFRFLPSSSINSYRIGCLFASFSFYRFNVHLLRSRISFSSLILLIFFHLFQMRECPFCLCNHCVAFLIQERRTNNVEEKKKKRRILVLYSSIYLTINATERFLLMLLQSIYSLNQFVSTIWLHTTESTLHEFVWFFSCWCCCWFSLISSLLILLCYWRPRDPMWWSCCDLTIHIFRQHFFFRWTILIIYKHTHTHTYTLRSRDASLKTCQMTWINRWTKWFEFTAIASLLHRRVLLWNSCWYIYTLSTRNWLLHINPKWVSISNLISSFVSVLVFFFSFPNELIPLSARYDSQNLFSIQQRDVDRVSEKGKKWLMSLT